MTFSVIESIRKKFLEEVNLIYPYKVKRNGRVEEIRDTIKLHCFDQIHIIQYINHSYLKG